MEGGGGLRAPMTGELCWREHKLLVEPPMPDRSKASGQAKCSPWSSRVEVGRGANDPTPEKLTVTKPSENQGERHWTGTYGEGQDPHKVAAPSKTEGQKPLFRSTSNVIIHKH
jgi:hypothetical protein